ncbi:universal stress protein [Oxalobacter formigenes]|jgi:nucleotide-binding universal stress UspA family protein|nr:universal stress protein [Oxalobacter formigenes]ARQ45687.1 TRAP-T-associated universal stress protein TeaD [Oxalobacter formigenes]ARQ77928.1 hypothetical protein BRW84_04340 [Oxalobacter formigenes OXCC13]MCZ4063087.1 universal stress protein [Oxalobacter formigenes]QDX33524.1 universal stress protein [Oxalobacter formigenes]WAW02335.1 universal stress protein [Oxalobacter formigenes]
MFKKILVPTDGSPLATQAAMEGIELAKKIGAEVVCVYVAKENQNSEFEFSDGKPQSWPTAKEYEEAVNHAAEQFMQPLRESAEAGNVKFTSETFISNTTAGYIVYAAEKNGCDLIYMASRGYTGWENFFMGGVASKVLAASQIPVLVYKVKKEQVPKKAKTYISPRI